MAGAMVSASLTATAASLEMKRGGRPVSKVEKICQRGRTGARPGGAPRCNTAAWIRQRS